MNLLYEYNQKDTIDKLLYLIDTDDELGVINILQKSNIDPSFNNNYLITKATMFDMQHLMKYLLSDSRIDPLFENDLLIKLAVEADNETILKFLLDDDRVKNNISHETYKEVILMIKSNNLVYILNTFLTDDDNFEVSLFNNTLLYKYLFDFYMINIVNLIIRHPKLKKTSNHNEIVNKLKSLMLYYTLYLYLKKTNSLKQEDICDMINDNIVFIAITSKDCNLLMSSLKCDSLKVISIYDIYSMIDNDLDYDCIINVIKNDKFKFTDDGYSSLIRHLEIHKNEEDDIIKLIIHNDNILQTLIKSDIKVFNMIKKIIADFMNISIEDLELIRKYM